MGLALSDGQLDAIVGFVRLLAKWNAVHNLTAVRTDEVLTHHLLDSLSIVPTIEGLRAGGRLRVLDVGSGGGFPGVPLAIACPFIDVTLIDAVQKKCAFLRQVRMELGLGNVEVIHARVEEWRAQPFSVIVSRAFSSLCRFVLATRHLLEVDGRWLAMKGPGAGEELHHLPPNVRLVDTVPVAVPGLSDKRLLVLLGPA